MAYYLKTDHDYGFRLVLGYETRDGTRIEIYEERKFASWHLTVLRSGEEFARECRCLSYKHAYSLFQKAVEMYEGIGLLAGSGWGTPVAERPRTFS